MIIIMIVRSLVFSSRRQTCRNGFRRRRIHYKVKFDVDYEDGAAAVSGRWRRRSNYYYHHRGADGTVDYFHALRLGEFFNVAHLCLNEEGLLINNSGESGRKRDARCREEWKKRENLKGLPYRVRYTSDLCERVPSRRMSSVFDTLTRARTPTPRGAPLETVITFPVPGARV